MSDRAAAVKEAMDAIEKNWGQGSVMRLGETKPASDDAIPSGSIGLDDALGIGGYARGRIYELFGPESSGKTTVALHAVANAQLNGGTALYIDSEHAMSATYARALGVNVDELILAQPSTLEEGMEIALSLIKSGGVDLLVVDSVAAMTPRAELEGDIGDATVGLMARLMSQTMRKITGPLAEFNTCAIFINQLRDSINTMGFGPKEVTPGGRALKFYSSCRLDVRRIATIKDGDEATGNRTKIKIVKNKVAVPMKSCEVEIVYGKGISREGELIDLGVSLGIVQKAGAWLKYDGGNLAQGRAKAVQALRNDAQLAGDIKSRIIAAL